MSGRSVSKAELEAMIASGATVRRPPAAPSGPQGIAVVETSQLEGMIAAAVAAPVAEHVQGALNRVMDLIAQRDADRLEMGRIIEALRSSIAKQQAAATSANELNGRLGTLPEELRGIAARLEALERNDASQALTLEGLNLTMGPAIAARIGEIVRAAIAELEPRMQPHSYEFHVERDAAGNISNVRADPV